MRALIVFLLLASTVQAQERQVFKTEIAPTTASAGHDRAGFLITRDASWKGATVRIDLYYSLDGGKTKSAQPFCSAVALPSPSGDVSFECPFGLNKESATRQIIPEIVTEGARAITSPRVETISRADEVKR